MTAGAALSISCADRTSASTRFTFPVGFACIKFCLFRRILVAPISTVRSVFTNHTNNAFEVVLQTPLTSPPFPDALNAPLTHPTPVPIPTPTPGTSREVIIKRFAEGFLTAPWHDPSELHGCGRFASDSWQIFCLGSFRPGDQVVAAAAASAAAVSAAANGRGSTKKSNSRKGSLDRNLAAYCRFAERSSSVEQRAGGEGKKGRREDETAEGPSASSVARKAAGEVAAASTLSSKKRRKSNAILREVGKGTAESPAPKKRGWLDKGQAPVLGARRGRSTCTISAGASKAARRGASRANGGRGGRAVGGGMTNREERPIRRCRLGGGS